MEEITLLKISLVLSALNVKLPEFCSGAGDLAQFAVVAASRLCSHSHSMLFPYEVSLRQLKAHLQQKNHIAQPPRLLDSIFFG
jgi:hypothetical protein